MFSSQPGKVKKEGTLLYVSRLYFRIGRVEGQFCNVQNFFCLLAPPFCPTNASKDKQIINQWAPLDCHSVLSLKGQLISKGLFGILEFETKSFLNYLTFSTNNLFEFQVNSIWLLMRILTIASMVTGCELFLVPYQPGFDLLNVFDVTKIKKTLCIQLMQENTLPH